MLLRKAMTKTSLETTGGYPKEKLQHALNRNRILQLLMNEGESTDNAVVTTRESSFVAQDGFCTKESADQPLWNA